MHSDNPAAVSYQQRMHQKARLYLTCTWLEQRCEIGKPDLVLRVIRV